MREIETLQKLLYAHPPVDEIDLIIRPPQHAVPEFELFGRDDLGLAAFSSASMDPYYTRVEEMLRVTPAKMELNSTVMAMTIWSTPTPKLAKSFCYCRLCIRLRGHPTGVRDRYLSVNWRIGTGPPPAIYRTVCACV